MLRIENPNSSLGPSGFLFHPSSGVKVSKWDPGYPEIREIADAIPQMNGYRDYTSFFGSRVITIEFRIYAPWASSQTTRREILDTLKGLCNPALRPFIYEGIDGADQERRIMVRPDSLSSPFTMPHTNEVQMQWVAPYGLWESGQIETVQIGPGSGGGLTTGRSYPLTFPRSYAGRAPSGGKPVLNDGNIEAYPALLIYGPCTDVTIFNNATNEQMKFEALNLTASQSLVINNRERSITIGGQPNISKYDKVDWTQSSWIKLAPGENQMSFNPTGYTETTKMQVAYRHSWI